MTGIERRIRRLEAEQTDQRFCGLCFLITHAAARDEATARAAAEHPRHSLEALVLLSDARRSEDARLMPNGQDGPEDRQHPHRLRRRGPATQTSMRKPSTANAFNTVWNG